MQRPEHRARFAGQKLFCFSELRDEVIDGVPSENLPMGSARAAEYGIPNVIVELDLLCPLTNWEKLGMPAYCSLFFRRVSWIRENCAKDAMIFVNIRDFVPAWAKQPARIEYFLNSVASQPAVQRISGVAIEEPTGLVLPCELPPITTHTREIMLRHGWSNGHLIAHIHAGFGYAEGAVLEFLASGGTGIWCVLRVVPALVF
jgi:hypothetical protein